MTPVLFVVISFFLFVFGAVIGSFLSVVILRTMRGESWVLGRSSCDECGKQISWYDNIPLLSFILLRGKCRNCRMAIHPLHFLVELLAGIMLVWWYWGGFFFFKLTQQPFMVLQPLFWLVVGLILLLIFFTDIVYMIIPDEAVLALVILTIFYRSMLVAFGVMQPRDIILTIAAAVIVFLFMYALWYFTNGKGMGQGDVKLVVPLALLLGWQKTIVGISLAFLIGAAFGLLLMSMNKATLKQKIPFGPFLILGSVLSLVWGEQIFHWYLGMLL